MRSSTGHSNHYFDNLSWEDITWSRSYEKVQSVQRRIFEASYSGDVGKIWFLQKVLLRNPHAKLISVYIISNSFRKWLTVSTSLKISGNDVISLAQKLDFKGEEKILVVLKSKDFSSKQFFLNLQDKAKQVLCKLTLEPEWKAKFGKNVYTFGEKKSIHELIHQLTLQLSSPYPLYVCLIQLQDSLTAIQRKNFLDKLTTFSLIREQISLWIQMGIFSSYKTVSYTTMLGVVLECPLYPLLVRIFLCGFEKDLGKIFSGCVGDTRKAHIFNFHQFGVNDFRFISYGGSIITISRKKELLNVILQFLKLWLFDIGADAGAINANIKLASQGFTFLGFHFIAIKMHAGSKVLVRPSKLSFKRVLEKTKHIIKTNKSNTSYELVIKLSLELISWAKYFQYSHCKDTFSKLDYYIYQQLRAWVFKRDPKHGRSYIKREYFPAGKVYLFQGNIHRSDWILNGVRSLEVEKRSSKKFITNFLPKTAWITPKKFVHASILS